MGRALKEKCAGTIWPEKHCKLFDNIDQLAARSLKNLGTCEKLICTAKDETCGYDGECCGGVCSGVRYSKSGEKFVKERVEYRWIDPWGYNNNNAFKDDLRTTSNVYSGTDTVKNTQNWDGKSGLSSPQVQEEREIKIFSWMVERGNIGWGIGRQSGYLTIKEGEAAIYQFFLVANDVARFQLSTHPTGEVKVFCKVDDEADQKNSKLWVGRQMGESWLDHGIYYYELIAINKNENQEQCVEGEGDKKCSCAHQGCPMDRLNYKYGSLPFDHSQAKVLWKTEDDATVHHGGSALRYIIKGWPSYINDPNDNSDGLNKHTNVATTDGSQNHEPGNHIGSEAGFMVFVSYEDLGETNFDDTDQALIVPAPADPVNELRKRKFSKFIRVDFFIKNDHSATRKYKFGLTIPKHMHAKIMVD